MALAEFIPMRVSAAAQSLGAPKVAGVTPQKATKGVARLPRAAKAKIPGVGAPQRAPAVKAHAAPARAQRAPQRIGPGSSPNATTFDPAVHGLYGPGELRNIAKAEEGQQIRSQLAPLKVAGQEVQQVGQTVANRYAAAGKSTEGTLQGLAQQAEGNAKTAENEMAQNTLNASKEINTTGQNAATNNAGYVDPQVRAALAAGAERATQTGATGSQLATARGGNENNYMSNIRAAAAQRIQEGQGNIAQTYAKQYGQIAGKEGALTERLPELAKTRAGQLGERQETEALTKTGLNIRGETLRQKGAESQAKNKVIERGQNLAGSRNSENTAQRERSSERSHRLNLLGKKTAKGSAEEKAAYDKARIRISEGRGASPASGRKYATALNNAYSIVHQEIEEGKRKNPSANPQQLYKQAVQQLEQGKHTGVGRTPGKPLGVNLIHAAMSLIYNNGKLVGKPRSEAIENGLSAESSWLK